MSDRQREKTQTIWELVDKKFSLKNTGKKQTGFTNDKTGFDWNVLDRDEQLKGAKKKKKKRPRLEHSAT